MLIDIHIVSYIYIYSSCNCLNGFALLFIFYHSVQLFFREVFNSCLLVHITFFIDLKDLFKLKCYWIVVCFLCRPVVVRGQYF